MPHRLEAMEQHAAAQGITVLYAPLTHLKKLGYYQQHLKLIVINNQTPIEYRVYALAHELGHAYHGHNCGTPHAEHYADQYAAKLLINPDTYRQAELEADGNLAGIAAILELPLSLIKHYQQHLEWQ